MRQADWPAYVQRLQEGRTLIVAIDYYALHMSRGFFSEGLLVRYADSLVGGKVVVLKATIVGDRINYTEVTR